jgi:hypothetical protein
MLKTLAISLCLVIGLAIYVTIHDEHATENAAQKAAQLDKSATAGIAGEYQAQHNVSDSKWYPPSWHRFFTWPDAVTAWGILLTLWFIAVQAQQTARAAKATEDAVEIANRSHALAERTAKQQLRAYICMDSTEVLFSKGVLVARVIFKNSGQTPAYEVQTWIGTEIAAHPIPVPLPQPRNTNPPKNTLGPDARTQLLGPRIPLLEDDLSVMFTTQTTLYVYGQLIYKDAFGDRWHTNFRMIAGGPEGARISQTKDGAKTWALSPDLEGNDAT